MRRKLPIALGLLVCFGIVGLLVASNIPSRRERRCGPSCQGNLKRICYACQLYAADHDETFPPSLGALVPKYMTHGSQLLCPSGGDAEEFLVSSLPEDATDASSIWDDRYTDYVYVKGLSGYADPECVLAHDKDGNHEGGRLVAFVGGMVLFMKEADFRAALAKTKAWIAEHPRPRR